MAIIGKRNSTDEYVVGYPTGPVAQWVAYYSGYRQETGPDWTHRGLPSPFVTLILTLDKPVVLQHRLELSTPPGSYDSLIGGLHPSPVLIARHGPQSGVQVHLNPLGARALLGLPAGELAELGLPAEDILGSIVDEMREALFNAANWPERFAAIDRVLQRYCREHRPHSPELRYIWALIQRQAGNVRIADLARETGLSQRRLGRIMRQEIGLTPKRAALVVRFDRARRRLQHDGAGAIADIAADLGYTDQAHLTHEFVTMSGLSPTQWLTAEFGDGLILDNELRR